MGEVPQSRRIISTPRAGRKSYGMKHICRRANVHGLIWGFVLFKECWLFNICHFGQRHPTRYMPRAGQVLYNSGRAWLYGRGKLSPCFLHLPLKIRVQVVAVARARGLDDTDLPLSSIDEAVNLTLQEYGTGGPAYKASMLVDFIAERPMEVEVIIGGVLRYAEAYKVLTPRYATLRKCQSI
jgi:hypothetical protein